MSPNSEQSPCVAGDVHQKIDAACFTTFYDHSLRQQWAHLHGNPCTRPGDGAAWHAGDKIFNCQSWAAELKWELSRASLGWSFQQLCPELWHWATGDRQCHHLDPFLQPGAPSQGLGDGIRGGLAGDEESGPGYRSWFCS